MDNEGILMPHHPTLRDRQGSIQGLLMADRGDVNFLKTNYFPGSVERKVQNLDGTSTITILAFRNMVISKEPS